MTAFLDMATARAAAESLMSSTCSIAPPAAEPVTDEETGAVTFPVGVPVYVGPCRVRPASGPGGNSSEREAGGEQLFAFDYLVSIPFAAVGSADVRERMRCTILTSPDPALVGVEVEVQHVDRGEHITARRLQCSEVA